MATALCLDVPALKLSHTAAKNVARKVLAGTTRTPVTDLAVALGRATKLGQTGAWAAVEIQVRTVGAGLDRSFVPVSGDSTASAPTD